MPHRNSPCFAGGSRTKRHVSSCTAACEPRSQVIEEARGVADRDLVGAEVVRISSAVTTDRSDGLPLVDGIARAGGVNISATAGEGGGDPGLEESAPVGIANPTDADEVTADGGTAEEVEEDVFDEVAEDVDDVAEDVTDDEVTADEVIADEVIPVRTTLPAEEDREPSLTSERGPAVASRQPQPWGSGAVSRQSQASQPGGRRSRTSR